MGGPAAGTPPTAAADLEEPSRSAKLLDLTLGRKLLDASSSGRKVLELPDKLLDTSELHALPAVLPETQSIKVRVLPRVSSY